MFIPIYSRQYTQTLTAEAQKQVVCEKCGTPYAYVVARMGRGRADSLYALNNQGAGERAAARAQRALHEKLLDAVEVVPCPHCQWVQAGMVVEARRRSYRRTLWAFGAVFPAILGLVLWFVLLVGTHYLERPVGPDYRPIALGLLAAIVVSLFVGHVLRRLIVKRIDPNAKWPGVLRPAPASDVPLAAIASNLNYADQSAHRPARRKNRWALPCIMLAVGATCWLGVFLVNCYADDLAAGLREAMIVPLVIVGLLLPGAALMIMGTIAKSQ